MLIPLPSKPDIAVPSSPIKERSVKLTLPSIIETSSLRFGFSMLYNLNAEYVDYSSCDSFNQGQDFACLLCIESFTPIS